jgi:uroporphyrinogen III methyltransferase/synthase
MLVSLVGAGPGDPGLVTRKAEQRLASADVVVYDALVSPAVLQMAKPTAELICRKDIHDGRQAAINAFLIDRARNGQRVVRLKGGDPFLFGRGGEEAEALARAAVPFEVVPGVSAGLAVPAYAGIPVTHRSLASDVTFVTGHEDPDKADSPVEWDRIVRNGGTIVIFMGVRRLPEVVAGLRAAGAGARLPVAVIEWGTTPRQKTVDGVLEDIVERVTAAGIDHPALTVVGRVVSLRRDLAWFDRRPLWGERVLVTRAREQASPLVEALRDAGSGVLLMPVLAFEPPSDPAMLLDTVASLARGERYDTVIFTSANGVRFFFQALKARRLDLRTLHGARVASIGPVTAEALEAAGIISDVVPEEFRAEDLFRVLGAAGGVRGKRFLLLRAEVARNVLPDSLREAGGIVDVVPCYRTIMPQVDRESARRHVELASVVTFTSPSSVQNLCKMLGEDAPALLAGKRLGVIGPITARSLEERGLTAHVQAAEYTTRGLVDALIADADARKVAT